MPLSLHVAVKHVQSIRLLFDAEKGRLTVRRRCLGNERPRTLGQKGCPMAARPEALQRAPRTPVLNAVVHQTVIKTLLQDDAYRTTPAEAIRR